MTDPEALPEPDRAEGAPHPRDTDVLLGHAAAEASFLEAFTSGRLHHGWLLTGPRGVGKATLAWKIARFLLSQPAQDGGGLFDAPPPPSDLNTPADTPLAHRMRAMSEPGLFVLRRPWDDKAKRLRAEITVDAVRALHNFFHMSASDGGRRVVIVDAADELNTAAANALLKVLEEPPARTTLLLIAHQPARLLPTILSRCRSLRLDPLGPQDLAEALTAAGLPEMDAQAALSLSALAEGSVGGAIALARGGGQEIYARLCALFARPQLDRSGVLALAEACAGRGAEDRYGLTLDMLQRLVARAARAGLLGPPDPAAAPDEAAALTRLAPHDIAARRMADLSARISARAAHARAVNLDPAAVVLDLCLEIEATAR